MAEINLVARERGDKSRLVWRDITGFEGVGIVVDDPVYDTGIFTDRDYDVQSLLGVSVTLENIGANSVDYTILGATKSFDREALDSTLEDADFTEILVADTPIGAGITSTVYELLRTTPAITAIRIRAKETVATNSGTLRGDVRAF